MTTNPHKSAALGQIHSPVNWSFTTATARRTPGVYVATDLGSESMQTDTSPPTFWKLVSITGSLPTVTPTWRQVTTAADLFSGNFLSVLPGAFQIMVSDQGVTNGSTIVRADQSGNGKDYSATGHNPTVASTLNSRATLLFNGSSQYMGSALALASPSTTPWEMVMVCKLNAYTSGGRLVSDSTAELVYQSGSPGISLYAGGVGATTSALTTGSWKLVKARATDSASDLIQAGSAVAVMGAGATMGATSGWAIAADPAGGNYSNIEVALVAFGPSGFAGAPFLAALDDYYNSLVQHP